MDKVKRQVADQALSQVHGQMSSLIHLGINHHVLSECGRGLTPKEREWLRAVSKRMHNDNRRLLQLAHRLRRTA